MTLEQYDPAAVRAAIAAEDAEHQRRLLRHSISATAGDLQSQLGTTDDTAVIAALGIAALTVSLNEAADYDAFKAAFLARLQALAGTHDMAQISADFLAHIADGSVVLPVLVKNMDIVWAEIEQRGTAKSAALSAAGVAS